MEKKVCEAWSEDLRKDSPMSKWMEKLTRQTDKYNPRKRKQYKKARYRKQARKFEELCEKEEAWAEEFERLHPNWVAEADIYTRLTH